MKKSYAKSKRSCRVTFELPSVVGANKASLCGEFNNWDPGMNPMTRRKDGRFSTTVSLEAGKEYRFRYLLDNETWENDWSADRYVPNTFGTEDSIVV